jgi:DNA polymerase III alpha subunit
MAGGEQRGPAAGASGGSAGVAGGPAASFAHLHLHTEYSLLDGGNRIDKLMDRVKALGMSAVACTDHGNLFGAVAFYLAAKERGIKPILGVEAYVAPGSRTDKTYTGSGDGGYHLVLLAENDIGWKNLMYLCSEAYLTGFYYKPRIDRALLEKHAEGLIAINGHLGSEIGDLLLEYERTGDKQYWDRAVASAEWHAGAFGGEGSKGSRDQGIELAKGGGLPRFFLELQHHIPEQNSVNKHIIRLARMMKLPLVCDNDAHFLTKESHDAHDTLVCISTGKGKNEEGRMRYPTELYVKSPAEMEALFGAGGPYGEAGEEALKNSVAIAERCNVTLPIGANHAPAVRVARKQREGGAAGRGRGDGGVAWLGEGLPKPEEAAFGGDVTAWYTAYCEQFEVVPFAIPEGASEEERQQTLAAARAECNEALRLLAEGGYVWRYGVGAKGQAEEAERRARLERELKILADKGISAYFLIVWDFVNWGRNNGVPALARGSGVGTMVGYVLGLSNACPVRYGLLFERFTDPDRSEYPDIDIDLCQDGRQRVIDYVRRKYGHVAQIITFGTLKARAAIRDVGRVLQMPLPEVDKVAKLVPEQLGITLDKALEQEPELKALYDRDPVVRRCLDNAQAIEGQARHSSVHAAGVIVATRPLHELVPLYRAPGAGSNEVVTQWDGPTCEKMGLLKMDFLGLRTISIVERAKKLIREGLGEEAIWEAVGRGEEYRKWSSGRVVEWSSGQGIEESGEVVPGSDRLAARNGPGASGARRDAEDAKGRAVRADQSDEAGGVLDSDEHRRGIRQAHTPRVRSRASDRGGLAAGADDRVRAGDVAGHDSVGGATLGAAGGGGSASGRVDSQPRGEVERRAGESLTGPGPLDHSTTRPLPPSHPLDLDRLSYADQTVFELFRRGDTTGVFQFESDGMRRLLREMKPDRLEDLIAANALFRPGPMDLIPDYNRRKHGEAAVPRVHEIVDRYTAETYGVMVYQEQVMQIVHGLGGIKLRDAYTLIKNISKKKHDKIEKERPKFVDGAQKQGLTKAAAEELFELILKFAGYGFNKSHSTGYAIVAYQTAYLKTYFPNQYMAAFLTYESGASQVAEWTPYLEDCKKTVFVRAGGGDGRGGEARTAAEVAPVVKTGVEVRPPDLNLSDADFTVVFEGDEPRTALHGHVRFGLSAIKGVGEKAIESILRERGQGIKGPGDQGTKLDPSIPRSHGPFTSLFDFCERVPVGGSGLNGGSVNKATIEALIKSGAMDCLHGRKHRAAMVASIESATSAGVKLQKDKASGQGGLFGFGAEPAGGAKDGEGAAGGAGGVGGAGGAGSLAKVEPWSESETLSAEKEALGFYVSSHPLEQHGALAKRFATATTRMVREKTPPVVQDARVTLAACVQAIRTIVLKQGKNAGGKMAVIAAEDQFGQLECVAFTEVFARLSGVLTPDAVLLLVGKVDYNRGSPQIVLENAVPIAEAEARLAKNLRLVIDETRLNGEAESTLRRAVGLLKASPAAAAAGGAGVAEVAMLGVEIVIKTTGGVVRVDTGRQKVAWTPTLSGSLDKLLGAGCVQTMGGGIEIVKPERKPWEKR